MVGYALTFVKSPVDLMLERCYGDNHKMLIKQL
jgi:hypothetical protein